MTLSSKISIVNIGKGYQNHEPKRIKEIKKDFYPYWNI